jgi:hypothetical protein
MFDVRGARWNVTLALPVTFATTLENTMRRACAIAVFILLSACASLPEGSTACTEPRPLVCTMQFQPTCAVLSGGGRKEFSSPCTACADAAVAAYVASPCAE